MKLRTGTAAAKLAGLGASLALLIAAQAALAQTGQVKGWITARNGEQITIKASDGSERVITLTGATKVEATVGALNVRTEDRSTGELVKGLPVTVDTMDTGGAMEAVKVVFKSGEGKTAQQIAAGTAEVEARNAAVEAKNRELQTRLANANEYVEKGKATVYFKTGSIALSSDGKSDLMQLAAKARGIKGYLIGVTGYADPTGDDHANQILSEKRALVVARYLEKYGNLQPGRVTATNAMGETHLVGDTSTAHGLSQNRRVEAKILVNKGLEGVEAPTMN